MKISAINNNYNQNSFKSWKRSVYKDSKHELERTLKHRNDTWFCRTGFNDGLIYDHVMEKFKDVDKVNTYFWGCSDGREVYGFLNELFIKSDPKTISKFTPIHAIDYDPVAILHAIHGCYEVEDHEILKLEESHGKKITENFDVIYHPLSSDIITHIIPKQELKDCVKFRLGDITKDTKKMKSENNLVFARNLWPYLNGWDLNNVAKSLYKNMGEDSLLIIGEYDLMGLRWNGRDCCKLFMKAGFKPVDGLIIFEK